MGTKNPVYLSLDIDTLDPACEFMFLGREGGAVCGKGSGGERVSGGRGGEMLTVNSCPGDGNP